MVLGSIIVRAANCDDAQDIARIQVESWRAGFKGVVHQSYLNGLSVEEKYPVWREYLNELNSTNQIFVALFDQKIIGFAHLQEGETGEFCVELKSLYVDPALYRRKVGAALFAHIKGLPYKKLTTWTLSNSPNARTFYQAMGGQFVVNSGQTHMIDEQEYKAVSYEWDLNR